MKTARLHELAKRVAARGGIVVFFVVALEVMIMISPFAFFFYSVFSPLFNGLDRYAGTRWLTAFFLPHMILPPTLFLLATCCCLRLRRPYGIQKRLRQQFPWGLRMILSELKVTAIQLELDFLHPGAVLR